MNARVDKSGAKPPRAIEWREVLRRVEAAQAAIDRAVAPTAEKVEDVLAARARRLARPPQEAGGCRESIEVVEFLLADERYGFESGLVREVVALKELTPLPGAPPYVLGVANVRGTIILVIDLKKFFGLPEKGLTDLNKLIILNQNGLELGVLGDVALGVRPVPRDQVSPPPATFTGPSAQYLRGVTPEGLIVLDADQIVSDENLMFRETSEATPRARQYQVL